MKLLVSLCAIFKTAAPLRFWCQERFDKLYELG
jgi:hypothetical protein